PGTLRSPTGIPRPGQGRRRLRRIREPPELPSVQRLGPRAARRRASGVHDDEEFSPLPCGPSATEDAREETDCSPSPGNRSTVRRVNSASFPRSRGRERDRADHWATAAGTYTYT